MNQPEPETKPEQRWWDEAVAKGKVAMYYGLHYEVCGRPMFGSNICDCDRIDSQLRIKALESELAKWRDLSRDAFDFATHGLVCPAQAGWARPAPCNCGLEDWLARLSALEQSDDR